MKVTLSAVTASCGLGIRGGKPATGLTESPPMSRGCCPCRRTKSLPCHAAPISSSSEPITTSPWESGSHATAPMLERPPDLH